MKNYHKLIGITFLLFTTNFSLISSENCKTVYSKSRTIILSYLLKNADKDYVIGFIKDSTKIFTRNDLQSIEEKYNVKINENCIKVILNTSKKHVFKQDISRIFVNAINEYFKNKRQQFRVEYVDSKCEINNLTANIRITSLKNIVDNMYEVKFLVNNKEENLKLNLKIVAPTLVAKKNLAPNSVLKRKNFVIRYIEYDKSNLSFSDWNKIYSPISVKTVIRKGQVIKKDYLGMQLKMSKKIIAIFKCKNFSITRQLQLKRIAKETIELEDTKTKKIYIAIPIDHDKAIIDCKNIRSNQ